MTYKDECGDGYSWEVPADPKDGSGVSFQSYPPKSKTENLTLKDQYYYSTQTNRVDGKDLLVKGSYADWELARDLNITVTHHAIGSGVWIFKPSILFTQPISVVYKNMIPLDRRNPIPATINP